MPAAALVGDVTNITYSNGSNQDFWTLQVREVGASAGNGMGTFYNPVDGFVDGPEGDSANPVAIEIYIVGVSNPYRLIAGDTFTITHNEPGGVGSLIIYPPAGILSSSRWYADANGVLYDDVGLTTAATTDFDSVSETIGAGEQESQESAIRHTETMGISESTSLTASNSVNDIAGVSESTSWLIEGGTVPATWPTPTVHYTGENQYNTDEAIFDSRLVAETDPVVGKTMKVFIKDDNGEWIDFSDRFNQKGIDKLADYGVFKHASERKGGLPILESTVSSVTLDNTDGFFDGRAVNLTTELGSDASFETSSDEGTETSWRRREVKFEVHLTLIDDSIITRSLGVFFIKESSSTLTDKKSYVSFTLESKMNLLKRTDASVVKDGMQWYRNKSINFLVTELLKTQFADSDNNLPNSFYINDRIELPIPSDIGSGSGYSQFGVPPQNAGSGSLEISFIRAMDVWTWNTGTVSSSTDYGYTLTTSTTWGQEGTSGALRPKPGDFISIKSSSNGNDGDYKITSISGNTVNLLYPLKGTTESSMSYTVTRLYLIYDDRDLYEFIPSSNTYSLIGSIPTDWHDYGGVYVPYKIFINDNRVYVLRCMKFIEDANSTQINDGSDWYNRLSVYDGSTLSYVSASPFLGQTTSSVALHIMLPVGMGASDPYLWSGSPNIQSNDMSENIQIPFTQRTHANFAPFIRVAECDDRDSYSEEITAAASGTTPNNYFQKGWYTIGDRFSSPESYEEYSFVYWDRGPFEIFVPSWDSGVGALVGLYKVRIGGAESATPVLHAGVQVYPLSDFNNDAGYHSYNTDWWATPICVAYADNDHGTYGDRCYMSVLWSDNPYSYSGATTVNVITSFAETITATFVDQWTETDKTVIDMCQYGSSTDYTYPGFVVSMMSREDDDVWYELGTRAYNGASWVYTKLRRSSSPYTRLTRGGPNEDYDVFMFHKYENRLLKYDHSAGVLADVASGNEIIDGENNLSSPLVIDQNTRADKDIIYGVSWSGEDPWALRGLRLPSRGVLWKLDTYLTPNVPLADFDGLDCAEAIGKLAQACNHVAFFNVTGDFYFVPREPTDTDDYIIEHVGGKSLMTVNAKKDRGYGEIYNNFTIVPSIVEVSEVEWEIIQVKREEGEDDRDFTQFVEVNSLNNLKRKTRLACTRGGLVSENPLFKFLVEYENIDARVGEEVDSIQTTFLLSSTFGGDQLDEGVHSGDFIIFTHPEDGTEIIKEILGGSGGSIYVSRDGGVIRVSDASNFNVGDNITIVSSTNRFFSRIVTISGDYITMADEPFDITFSGGDLVLSQVKGTPSHITIESATGVTIPKNSEVTIIRVSAADDSSTDKAWSSDGVTYITDYYPQYPNLASTVIHVNNIDWISVGCYIEINTASTIGPWAKVIAIDKTTNAVTLDTGKIGPPPQVELVHWYGTETPSINVYWSPDADEFVEIPQSGFNVKVENGDGTIDPLFKQGDIFTISTEGLVLKDDSKSRKIAVSLTSKGKHGKLDFPSIKNRFITPQLAEVLSRNLLELYKSPHYHLKLNMYYLPLIDFVRINRFATFKITSDKLFPNQKDFTRSFYLRSFSIDIKKNIAALELIDKDAY